MSRAMRDEAVRVARHGHLHDRHIEPLTQLVGQIRRTRDGSATPWFDPKDGGIRARVLLLLEAPGRQAAPAPSGSGLEPSQFVSLDNDDGTAANLHELVSEAGLRRRDLLIWNIIPWYLGDKTHSKVRAARNEDLDEGAVWLNHLLECLSSLRIAVLLGEKSQKGWFRVAGQLEQPLPVLACPHPSPRSLDPHPERRETILRTLQAAAKFASAPGA